MKKLEEEKAQKRKELTHKAIEFFSTNTVHIDIWRNSVLARVFFPLLPFCK